MSVIEDLSQLELKSDRSSGEPAMQTEKIPDKIQNVDKELKRSTTLIMPARSNSIPSNSQFRNGYLKQIRSQRLIPQVTRSLDNAHTEEQEEEEEEDDDGNDKVDSLMLQKQRGCRFSTEATIVSLRSITKLFPSFNLDRLRKAREITEKAIKMNKIFTIQGGYAIVRNCLRKRGWVENFFRTPEIPKKPVIKIKSDALNSDYDDDDDDDDAVVDAEVDVPRVKPWEEEDGLYGIMSRMVRNLPPALFWVLRRDLVDYRSLTKFQMVNHFSRSSAFTTKVGLCVNLRNLHWFDEMDPNMFFPRCYRLNHDEEKGEFIDDFNFTICVNILKIVVDNNINGLTSAKKSSTDSDKKAKRINDATGTPKKPPQVPVLAVIQAFKQCESFIRSKENMDVDMDEKELEYLTDSHWERLREWYYQLLHQDCEIIGLPMALVNKCEANLKRLKILCPQFHLDGKNSVWILKPGAKSRGRGIMCYNRLEEILKLAETNISNKESKYVIQKYIERPLLIYNCKFDIRQWFLITDWNPLTMWFYRDSYLRFCSQQFTLSKFDKSIHLCNNAVQKNCKNGPRAKELPDSNMWSHYQFKEYLSNRSLPNIWDELIYPGMKKALICSMFVSQELVEPRKGSFELYGADFMLTEDYSPWLIEINSRPSMEASTEITSKLCTQVLEDTIKVVLDRKTDKNCDIGRFEMGYKQTIVNSPPYLCMNMLIEGQAIKRRHFATKRFVQRPQDSKDNVLKTLQQAKRRNNNCKETVREKSENPPVNKPAPKKSIASVPNRKLVKSQTCLETCSTWTIPGDDNLKVHTERLRVLSNKMLGADTQRVNKGEEIKKHKKVDYKVIKANNLIRHPLSLSAKSLNQIPLLETQKLKTNLKCFRKRPKKTLITPIARIQFPLEISKQPYPLQVGTRKNI